MPNLANDASIVSRMRLVDCCELYPNELPKDLRSENALIIGGLPKNFRKVDSLRNASVCSFDRLLKDMKIVTEPAIRYLVLDSRLPSAVMAGAFVLLARNGALSDLSESERHGVQKRLDLFLINGESKPTNESVIKLCKALRDLSRPTQNIMRIASEWLLHGEEVFDCDAFVSSGASALSDLSSEATLARWTFDKGFGFLRLKNGEEAFVPMRAVRSLPPIDGVPLELYSCSKLLLEENTKGLRAAALFFSKAPVRFVTQHLLEVCGLRLDREYTFGSAKSKTLFPVGDNMKLDSLSCYLTPEMNGSNSYQVVVCNAGGKPILLTSIMLKAGLPVSFVANPGPSNDGSEFSCRVGDLEMFSNNYIRNGSRGFLVPGKPPFPNIEELDIDGQDNYVHTPQQAAISCLLSNLIIAPDRVSVSIKKQSIDNSWNDEGAAGFLGIATWIYEVGLGTLKVELEVEEIPIHAEFIVSHVPGGHGPALHLSKLSVAGLDCDSLGRNKAKWLESELGKQLLQMSDVGIQLKALAQGCYEQNHFRVERYETAGAKLHEKLQELCSQNGSELIEKAKREVGGFSEYCEYRRLETLPVGAWMLSDKEVALATVVNQSNEPALGHEYGHVTREDSGAYQYRPAKKVTEYSYVGPLAFVVGDRRGDYAVQATFSDRLEGMRTVDWGAPEGAPYWASDVDVFTCSFLGSIRATLRVSSVQYLEGEKLFGEPKAVEEFQAKKRALYEQTKKTDLPSVALAMAIKALVIEEPPLEPILDTVRRSILLGTTNFAPIFKRLVGNEWAQTVCKKMDDALRIANQFGTP